MKFRLATGRVAFTYFSPADRDSLLAYRNAWQATNRLLRQGHSFSGFEPKCVYLNCRGSRFANVSSVTGLDFVDDGRALGVTDWDQDGDLDVWLGNRTGPRLRLMRNSTIDGSRRITPTTGTLPSVCRAPSRIAMRSVPVLRCS